MSLKKSRTIVCVVGENLNEVKVSTSNKQSTSTSEKSRKRAVEYVKDKNKRIDCRYERRKGIISDIRNLKLCTEDNIYLEFYKEEANELVRFCTSSDIMMQHNRQRILETNSTFHSQSSRALSTSSPIASPNIPKSKNLTKSSSYLAASPSSDHTIHMERSPSCSSDGLLEVLSRSASISNTSTKKKKDENTCQICSIEHGSVDDLYSPWIGSSFKSCTYWIHLIFWGIECLQENLKFIGKYWCAMHNKSKLVKARLKLLK